MPQGLCVKLSMDKKHIWLDDHCCSFEAAKVKAHEILDVIDVEENEKEAKELNGAAH